MAMLTLVELNHDKSDHMNSPEFLTALADYLRLPQRDTAEALLRFGVIVHGMCHHSDRVTRGFRSPFQVGWWKIAYSTK